MVFKSPCIRVLNSVLNYERRGFTRFSHCFKIVSKSQSIRGLDSMLNVTLRIKCNMEQGNLEMGCKNAFRHVVIGLYRVLDVQESPSCGFESAGKRDSIFCERIQA